MQLLSQMLHLYRTLSFCARLCAAYWLRGSRRKPREAQASKELRKRTGEDRGGKGEGGAEGTADNRKSNAPWQHILHGVRCVFIRGLMSIRACGGWSRVFLHLFGVGGCSNTRGGSVKLVRKQERYVHGQGPHTASVSRGGSERRTSPSGARSLPSPQRRRPRDQPSLFRP